MNRKSVRFGLFLIITLALLLGAAGASAKTLNLGEGYSVTLPDDMSFAKKREIESYYMSSDGRRLFAFGSFKVEDEAKREYAAALYMIQNYSDYSTKKIHGITVHTSTETKNSVFNKYYAFSTNKSVMLLSTARYVSHPEDQKTLDAIISSLKYEKKVSSITLNKSKATIKKGKSLKLSVKKIKPSDAFNKKVTWSSSNKKVATVDKNGKVKAKGKGTCTITCTAKDGSKVKAKCKITVK